MGKLVVTIVMSVYNGASYLAEAIESILQQTFRDFEFIIINDGSTDASWEIIQRYANQDARIVPIIQDNIGLTRSLNRGIQLAKGEYIARQDADDFSVPTRFEQQLPWLADYGYDLCCSRTWLLNEKRVTPRLGYWLPKKILLLQYNPFIHGTFLLRKQCLIKLNGYDEHYLYGQDYELIVRLFIENFRIKYLKDHLYTTRETRDSISVSKKKEQEKFGDKIKFFWRDKIKESPSLLIP